MIACDKNLLDEMNTNTVNCLDDIDEIINKKESQLSYLDFMSSILRNFNFMQDFFNVDEGVLTVENKLLENLSFFE